MDLDVWRQDTIVCAHCKHRFTIDEMNECRGEVDVWAMATQEDTEEIECPVCDQKFMVQGGYQPHWSSAFAEEQF